MSRPLLIAHRAANSLATLRAAEAAGADMVEADVWAYHGALEVRHAKTAGPVPVLWDRWSLAPAWAPRLSLEAVARACDPTTVLLLDLKGRDPLLPEMVTEAMAAAAPGRKYAVTSRTWALLREFWDVPDVPVFHSVGSKRELAEIWPRLQRHDRQGVSIHRRYLSQLVVGSLKEKAAAVITWPINTRAAFDEVRGFGADGVTTDSLELLRGLRDEG